MTEEAPTMSADGADPGSSERLKTLRTRVEVLDQELVRVVGERRALVLEIGKVKEALGLPVLDPPREARVVRRAAELARSAGVDDELIRDVIWRIIASARAAQEGRTSWGPPEMPASSDADGSDGPDGPPSPPDQGPSADS